MKKTISLLMMLMMVFALAGCDSLPGGDSGSGGSSAKVVEPEDEYAEGYMGDIMRTEFFDFTVNSATLTSEYEGFVPTEGNELLVVDITTTNTDSASIPMFDGDFQAQWGDDENVEAYAYPTQEPITDKQLPIEYELGIKESRNGILVFEVPVDQKDFSVSHMEFFDDESTGDTFFVLFTPERTA